MNVGNVINGYKVEKEGTNTDGGNCIWTFASKGGKEYFFKQFLTPKYPSLDSPGSNKKKQTKKEKCEKFEKRQRSIKQLLHEKSAIGGNLICPVDFFRMDSFYYKVTEKIEIAGLKASEICTLTIPSKLNILKSVLHSLRILHRCNLIHCDIKPANILIKKTETLNYTAKLIDFDDCLIANSKGEETIELMGDPPYHSPEVLYFIQNSKKFTGKEISFESDIFSLGIVFFEYIYGRYPDEYLGDKYKSLAAFVLDGGKVIIPKTDSEKLNRIGVIIEKMLVLNPSERISSGEAFNGLKEIGSSLMLRDEGVYGSKSSTDKKGSTLRVKGWSDKKIDEKPNHTNETGLRIKKWS